MISKKNKRVAFTFDERSLTTLEEMTDEGNFSSMADTVRESLQISRALQTQAKKGFSEIIVRNPNTGEERIIIIPFLQSLAKE
jgi:Arc/MetJ-type ribon-helix-helix transcriptional regulator